MNTDSIEWCLEDLHVMDWTENGVRTPTRFGYLKKKGSYESMLDQTMILKQKTKINNKEEKRN